MPERNDYAPGTPSWIDIGTDVEGAKKFYCALFGWDAAEAGPPEESGGYGFFNKNGKMVAGFANTVYVLPRSATAPQQNPGPPYWNTYVGVADADATANLVEKAGGTVVVAPMDVTNAGRMAVFQDPQGAFFSIWQPGRHRGAQLANEPGAFCWNELNARDTEVAKTFYAAAFGWAAEMSEGGPMPYTEFKLGGESIAGMLPMPPMVPAEVPSYWLVYFGVDDVDATTEQARQLGGQVLVTMDSPAGRFAVLTDPQGATFAVIKLVAREG